MTHFSSLAHAVNAESIARRLFSYCRVHDWAGYDPYDALNSSWFQTVPILNTKLPRLVLTQALKRSPVNVRPLMQVPPTQNPKALALFLGALLKCPQLCAGIAEDVPAQLIERLIALRSPGTPYWCWGYSFAWQTRTRLVPRGTPNLVCTAFVAESLLDAYVQRRDSRCLDMAVGAAEYIRNELYREDRRFAGFSYPLPSEPARIFNANLLTSALFCRVAALTGDRTLLDPALKAARYAVSQQCRDGSWPYGEGKKQQWIDNFHTGYNLCALRAICRYAETQEFEPSIRSGFEFYQRHFIEDNGAPRYFHDRLYPIDVHCASQSLITLMTLKEFDQKAAARARSVLKWSVAHLWDDRGYFYYRILPFCTIGIPYMRWAQAWMLLALAVYLQDGDTS